MTTKKITLDLWDNNNIFVTAIQGEVSARFLEITFKDGENNFDLSNKTVQIYFIKPDGTEIYNSANVTNAQKGIVSIELTSQMSDVYGTCKNCELRIVSENGKTLKVKGLQLSILKGMSDDAIESTNEFTALEEAMGDMTSVHSHLNSTNNPHNITTSQIGAIDVSQKGVASGVATLDANGKLVQLPNASDIGAIANSEKGAPLGVATLNSNGNLIQVPSASAIGAVPSADKGAPLGVATLNSNGKLQSDQLDTSSDNHKIKLINLAEEVQDAIAGTAAVISSVEDGSLTSSKYANSSVTYGKLADKAAIQLLNGFSGNISSHVDANPSGNPASVNTGEWYYDLETIGIKSNNVTTSNGNIVQNQLRIFNGFGTGFDDDINYSNYDHSYIDVPSGMTKIGNQKAVAKEIEQSTSLRYLPMTVSFGDNNYSGEDITLTIEFMLQGLNGDTTSKTGTLLNTVQDATHTYFGNPAQTFKKANMVFEVNKVYRMRLILKNLVSNPTSLSHMFMFKNQSTFNIIYSRFSVTVGAYQLAEIPLTKKESFDLMSASECVTSALISDAAVTTAKLANNAVTSAKISDSNITSAKLADKAAIQTINGFNGNTSDHVDANPSGDPASVNTGEWYYDIDTIGVKSNNVVTAGGNIIHNQLRTYNGFGTGFDSDVNYSGYDHSYVDVPLGMTKIGEQKAVMKEIENASSIRYLPLTVSFGDHDYSGEDITITVEFMLQGLNGDTTNKTGTILNTVQDATHTYFGNPAQTFKKANMVFEVNKVYRMRLILKNLVSNPTSVSHILTFANQTTFNIIYSRFSVTRGAHQLADIPLTKKENAAGLDVDISNLDTRVSALEIRKFDFSELFDKALFAGDSLTVGHYYDNDNVSKGYAVQNYPYYMNKKHGWDILVKAVGGMDAKSWWNSYGNGNYSDCDVCFLWLGTNNGLTDTLDTDVDPYDDPADYANTNTGRYCRIIEKLKSDNSYMKIFLITIFSSNSSTTNPVINKIATKYHLDVIDLNDGSVVRTTYPWMHNTHGNIHFTKMGNIGLANIITEKMNMAIQNNATAYEQPVSFQS